MSKGPKHTNRMIEEMKANLKPIVDGQCEKMITIVNSKKENEEKLHTCSRATTERNCKVYQIPELQWRRGDCPMADEALRTAIIEEEAAGKVRVGQQKQKKHR